VYHDERHNTLFDVSPGSRFLDLNDYRIGAAMEIAKRAMMDMQREGGRVGIRLVIILIPTKERVYGALLRKAGHVDKNARLDTALQQEDAAREAIVGFLREQRIEFVDLLPALEAEVVRHDLYPLTDGHPNSAGYRVIAESINRYLNSAR
jgi:lysophospholipase L1-like esterase